MITTVSDKEIAQAATIERLRQEVTAWSVTVENLEAELESKLDSDLEKIAAERYKVVPAHESMFHRWAVVAGDGTQQLYLGREAECQNMARKFAGAFLDGAYLAQQLRQEITAWSITAENLEAELERERIRLAACGVVAMSDTPDSAAKARQMLPEYESGSLDDVKRRVDECMALRAERDALAADAERLNHLIDNRAYIVSDASCCDGYWLHYERPDGSTWFQLSEYETPRAAIDAAMNKGGAT